VSDEQLLMRVLSSGGSRGQIGDLLGMRGVRLKAALPFLAGLQGKEMTFSPSDIKSLHGLESDWDTAWAQTGKASIKVGPGRLLMAFTQMFSGEFEKSGDSFASVLTLGVTDWWKKTLNKLTGKAKDVVAETAEKVDDTPDPAYVHRRMEEQRTFGEKREAAEKRVTDQIRAGLDVEQRRGSIQKELAEVQARMKEENERKNIDPLVSDGEFIQRQQLKVLELAAREVELRNSLRERPMDWGSGDHLAKSGLYSANALLFGKGTTDTNREQLTVLYRIERNTASKPNPHAR
jgi:hypothetical protein